MLSKSKFYPDLLRKVICQSTIQNVKRSSQAQEAYDVLLVGGGIMGASTAHWLALRNKGLRIGVVEQDPTYNASATTLSVGGLRQQFSLHENIQIGLYARDFMREYPKSLFSDLEISSGVPDVRFQPHGYLFLASEAGCHILEENHRNQKECGASTEMLSPAQLKEKFPWLSTDGVVAGCYGGHHEGWFDPWALLQAFKQSALCQGVEFITGRATSFSHTDGRPSQVSVNLTDGSARDVDFDKLVICAGGDSGHVGLLVGIGLGQGDMSVGIPVEKRKRYVYVPHCPDGPGLDCPLVIDPCGVYFRREGLGGNYLCGQSPTEEQEPKDTNLDVVDMDWFEEQVWPVLANRVKAFESLKVKSAWAGNYDYNVWDQNGVIGQHPCLSNVYMACGFSGHGIQQGPAVGRAMAELIIDGRFSSIDLTKFGFQRLIDGEKVLERNIV